MRTCNRAPQEPPPRPEPSPWLSSVVFALVSDVEEVPTERPPCSAEGWAGRPGLVGKSPYDDEAQGRGEAARGCSPCRRRRSVEALGIGDEASNVSRETWTEAVRT